MSEEEKKAINDLNFIIVTDVYDEEVRIDKTKIVNEYNKSVGIVLNLIKKQQKEIKRQKEKKEIAEEYYIRLYENKIKADKLLLEINKRYVNKDKIRELINKDALEVNTKEYGNIEVIAKDSIQELLEEK